MSDNVPKPIELNLSTDTSPGQQDDGASGPNMGGAQMGGTSAPVAENRPVMGYIAATCGFLSIIMWGIVFVPLGIVTSIIALFMGQGMWAVIGLFLSLIGLMTSPVLLGILGLGFIAGWIGL